MTVLPRLIRVRDVPNYLGMDINRFNKEVRPKLIAIPIGKQGCAFDRHDLDRWVDHYKEQHGQIQSKSPTKRSTTWEENVTQDCKNAVISGELINGYSESDFAKAAGQATLRKRRNTSHAV